MVFRYSDTGSLFTANSMYCGRDDEVCYCTWSLCRNRLAYSEQKAREQSTEAKKKKEKTVMNNSLEF